MKLHLPFRLRASLLAAIAMLGGIVPTLSTGSLAVGVCAYTLSVSTAQGKEFSISTDLEIPAWQYGTTIGGEEFENIENPDDPSSVNLVLIRDGADVTATLTGEIQSHITIASGSSLTLGGTVGLKAGSTVNIGEAFLELTSTAAFGGASIGSSLGSSWVVINWGDTTAGLTTDATDGYRGNIRVQNAAFTLTAGQLKTKEQELYLCGGTAADSCPVLTLVAGTFSNAFRFEGVSTVQVGSGSATIQGPITGSGTLIKTGAGTLELLYESSTHDGILDIQAGTVQWGPNNGNANYQVSTVEFSEIRIAAGASWSFGNAGISMLDQTDIYSTGGTIHAIDIRNAGGALSAGFRSLHVSGSTATTLTSRWKVVRTFGVLTSDGEEVSLVLNDTSAAGETVNNTFEKVENFSGSITSNISCGHETNKHLFINHVDVNDGKTLTVQGQNAQTSVEVETYEGKKTGNGTWAIQGGYYVHSSFDMSAGALTITGALSADFGAVTVSGGTTTLGSLSADSVKLTGGSMTMHGDSSVGDLTLSTGSMMVDNRGSLTAKRTIGLSDGATLEVGGALSAHSMELNQGTLEVGGALEAYALALRADTDAVTVGGSVTIRGDLELQQGSLTAQAGDMQIGGSAVVAGSLNASGRTVTVMHTLSLETGGALTAASMDVGVLELGGGTLNVHDSLTVQNVLTMNYEGSLTLGATDGAVDVSKLRLGSDIVLSYGGGSRLLSLAGMTGDRTYHLDLSGMDMATLQSGIDLGIANAVLEENINIASLSKASGSTPGYHLERDPGTGTWHLTVDAGVTLNNPWDENWGTAVVARGASYGNLYAYETAASPFQSLRETAANGGNRVIAAAVSASSADLGEDRLNDVYGIAYSTSYSDPVGSVYESSVWMKLSYVGGNPDINNTFNVVAGGAANMQMEPSTMGASWGLKGNVYIDAEAGVQVSTLVAGNVFTRGDEGATFEGDAYISLHTDKLQNSLIGGSILGGASGSIMTHIGDTYLCLYAAQAADHVTTEIRDYQSLDDADPVKYEIKSNAIIGGNLSLRGNSTRVRGDVSILFADYSNGTTNRSVIGGNYSYNANQIQDLIGDTDLEFRNMQNAGFGYVVVASNALWGAVTQTHTGNTAISATEGSSSLTFNGIVGGQLGMYKGGNTASSQGHTGSAEIQLGTSLTLNKLKPDTAFNANDLLTASFVGGNFYWDAQNHREQYELDQTRSGSTQIVLGTASENSTATEGIVGGHYIYSVDVYDPDATPADYSHIATQDQTGRLDLTVEKMSISSNLTALIGGHSIVGRTQEVHQLLEDSLSLRGENLTITSEKIGIVGGHSAILDDKVAAIEQQIDGSVSMKIADSSVQAATYGIVGAGLVISNHAATQTLNGSVAMELTNVNVAGAPIAVVGGHVSNRGTSIIGGNISLTIDGGSFAGTVIGGTYNAGTANCHNISLFAQNASFTGDNSIVGGHYNSGGDVDNVSVVLKNCTVSGNIYGGSYGQRVTQGNISLELDGGTYSGAKIVLAGNQANYTGSTTLTIHAGTTVRAAEIHGGGAYRVTGNRTARFVESGDFSSLSQTRFVDFNYFDVVESAARVQLYSSIQLANNVINKVGEGTLALSPGSNISNTVDVREGTLELVAGTSRINITDLYVRDDAVLHLSNSGGTTQGGLTLCSGSTLRLDPQFATARAATGTPQAWTVRSLVWGDQAEGGEHRVTLDFGDVDYTQFNIDEDGYYKIALFSGLTDVTKIQGLDWQKSVIRGESSGTQYWAVNAADYVVMEDGSSVLDGQLWYNEADDTLYLTNSQWENRYWTGDADGTWDLSERHWHFKDDELTPHAGEYGLFEQNQAAFFTKDGTVTDHAEVSLGEDITAGSVVLKGDNAGATGYYDFRTGAHTLAVTDNLLGKDQVSATFAGMVTIGGDLTVKGASSLDFSQAALALVPTATVTVDETSRLHIGNDVSVKKLTGGGTTTVDGKLTLGTGSTNAGTLTAEELVLGGSTSFKALNVDGAVTGNNSYTLTVAANSSMGSLDGGSLVVTAGTTTIGSRTHLTALSGAGALKVSGNALTLAKASSIGALTAGSVTVGETLSVTGTLTAGSITLSNLSSVSQGTAALTADMITSGNASAVTINILEDVIRAGSYHLGVQYTVVDSERGGSELSLNGHGSTFDTQDGHYRYHLWTETDGDVCLQKSVGNHHYFSDLAETENGLAGGKLLDEVLSQGALPGQEQADSSDLVRLIDRLDTMANDGKSIDKTMAAAAGSSIATVGLAFAEDMQRQLKSIRNRTTVMGVDGGVVNEGMPYYNAWINAEGSSHQFGNDGTKAGYSLNSFGGTVGFDVDVNPSLTCGLALTALTGDFTSDDVDKLDGNLDTQYLTAFARYVRRAWTHTLVFSVGRADVSADRTVTCEDLSYKTKYDSDGMAFGFLYELGRVFALNESHTACIQPLVNVMWTHSSMSGAEETGSDAGLKVDDMTMDTLTFGAGARVQALVGEDIYNRSSILEARALLKLDVGDRQGEADVAFAALNAQTQKVKSAEAGPVGLEIGAGITIPVGPDSASVFADASLELRSGYVNGAGTVGIRVNF